MPKKRAIKKATPATSNEVTAKSKTSAKKHIESYSHVDKKRSNNPPVGLVTSDSEPMIPTKKVYAYDPHLDPQLMWAGKSERTSFEVPTVSLHVHERIDPKAIIAAVRTNGDRVKPSDGKYRQLSLFEEPATYLPLRDALDFYKHPHGWTNRLVAGDSLLVMNSLLEKEGMAGKIQMVYIDPPYGIRYGSNFQPFVNKRDVKDGKDEDLTQEPETLKAFRDTWELGIHSYLTYLRDRLLLSRELLTETGSVFVQISNENLHHIREMLDEIYGSRNLVEIIAFRKKTMPLGGRLLEGICDYLVWYARDKDKIKYRSLFQASQVEGDSHWNILVDSGTQRKMSADEINDHKLLPAGSDVGQLISLYPAGAFQTGIYPYVMNGVQYNPQQGRSWKTPIDGMKRLELANRLIPYSGGKTLRYLLRHSDYPVSPLSNLWADTSAATGMRYVVETNVKVVARCLLMTTDPGDLVFDPTCGSGTTAFVAEQWGRRWITCDTSRVAITLAKQRLTTAVFDYYTLAEPNEGIGSGFKYKTVPHVTLKSIANNPEIVEGMTREAIDAAIRKYADHEVLYDQPEIDRNKARVTGPFTYEAVPAINVREIEDLRGPVAEPLAPDTSISRSGVTSRQEEWRDELARTGVRGKGGTKLEFLRLEPLPGTRYLHAVGETKDKNPRTVAVSFGPEHAPLEQRHVELAWEEARTLKPKPEVLLFAAFHFDPEAAKDIDELDPQKAGMQLLKLQMNTDLLTDDLKKKRSSNESFWLVGQPDVTLRKIHRGPESGRWEVEVHGFDYYNPSNGKIESGDTSRIAMWLLDTDYDGRSLLPRQVFFPMSGEKDGWSRLSKNLKAEIDEDLIEAYRGTISLPFDLGINRRIAAKIIDDRGIECLKIINVER